MTYTPSIALLGLPQVGKSTLSNALRTGRARPALLNVADARSGASSYGAAAAANMHIAPQTLRVLVHQVFLQGHGRDAENRERVDFSGTVELRDFQGELSLLRGDAAALSEDCAKVAEASALVLVASLGALDELDPVAACLRCLFAGREAVPPMVLLLTHADERIPTLDGLATASSHVRAAAFETVHHEVLASHGRRIRDTLEGFDVQRVFLAGTVASPHGGAPVVVGGLDPFLWLASRFEGEAERTFFNDTGEGEVDLTAAPAVPERAPRLAVVTTLVGGAAVLAAVAAAVLRSVG